MAEEYDFLFKTVVVGDGGSGKTAVVVRFSQGFFQENYKLTIGVEFAVKMIKINNHRVKLQIWDTGGQERFQYVRPLYYKGSMGCIVLFDLTNRESYAHVPKWLEEVKKEVGEIPVLLVGNKSDLINERVVTLEETTQLAKDLDMFYIESSAKNGKGVGDIFAILSLLMIGEDVPPEMLQISTQEKIPTQLKMDSNKLSQAKPIPVSTSEIKSQLITKHDNTDRLKSYSSEKKSIEPKWFAPAVSPKPKPQPFIKQKPTPEPQPFIKQKPTPEPQPFIKQKPTPEPQPFIKQRPTSEPPTPIKKEKSGSDSIRKDFFAPQVPKKAISQPVQKKALMQKSKNEVESLISSNPFLSENRQPILPTQGTPFSLKSTGIPKKKTQEKGKISHLFSSLRKRGKDKSKEQFEENSSWGFMSNVSKPSIQHHSQQKDKNNLSFIKKVPNETNKQPSQDPMIKLKCPRCGALINKHFKFCNKCGNRI